MINKTDQTFSHVVTPCICHSGSAEPCMIPGHGHVPVTIDPSELVTALREIIASIDDSIKNLMVARRAWVGRGLPGEYPIPQRLDQTAGGMAAWREQLVNQQAAAQLVARRHEADTQK